jgi:hypothetical protein
MKKSAILLLWCSAALGCAGNATDDVEELYSSAAERSLEDVIAQPGAGAVLAEAESLIGDLRAASEARALAAARDVYQAQATFMSLNRRYALTLQELVEAGTLTQDPSLADSGYRIRMRGSPSANAFSLSAEPSSSVELKRSFFVDETGVLRSELGQAATRESPELDPIEE